MIEADWQDFSDRRTLEGAVALFASTAIHHIQSKRGAVLAALPGGATPRPILDRLGLLIKDWTPVTIIPTDDRLAPAASPLSNFGMICGALTHLGATVLSLVANLDDYRKAGQEAQDRLASLPWPLDLVWLGMGADGHTASIFPGPDLETALTTVQLITPVLPDPLPPEAPVARVSLSASAIRQAGHIFIVITGAAKRAVLQEALADGAGSRFVIGKVLAGARAKPQIFWSPDA